MHVIIWALVALGLFYVPLPAPVPPADPGYCPVGGILTRLDGAGRFESKFFRCSILNKRFRHDFVDFDDLLAAKAARRTMAPVARRDSRIHAARPATNLVSFIVEKLDLTMKKTAAAMVLHVGRTIIDLIRLYYVILAARIFLLVKLLPGAPGRPSKEDSKPRVRRHLWHGARGGGSSITGDGPSLVHR